MSERGKWSGADARGFVATVLRDRDALWRRVLVAELDTRDAARVLAAFNRNRPDSGPPLDPPAEKGPTP